MAWWAWGIVGLVTVAVAALFARRYFRSEARRELVAHLRESMPGLEVVEEHEDRLLVRMPDKPSGPLYLGRFYADMAGATAPEARRVVLERWASVVEAGRELVGTLTLAEHGPRVLPRLVPLAFFDPPMDAPMPRRQLGDTGLWIVYVLDSPQSVAYLTDEHARDLGLTPDGLHALAVENLGKRTPKDVLAKALGGTTSAKVTVGDSYDAARVLLLPGLLGEGEALAAVIADRDSLAVTAVPADGDWAALRKLAHAPGRDRLLLDRPLLVTREGFELA
jgi:hypothetical protein